MPAKGRQFIAPPIASGPGANIIASPFQFYTTGEDRLLIISANSVANTVIKIQARILDPDGTIRSAVWSHVPHTDRSVTSEAFPLNDGAILNVVLFVSGSQPQDGQCYVQLFLRRGDGAGAIILGQLVGGYCTANQPLGWPGTPIRSSLEGNGALITFAGTPPAAGTDFSQTVPTGVRWQLLRFSIGFQASAAVASRVARFRWLNGVDIDSIVFWPNAIAASEVWFLTAGPGAPQQATTAGHTQAVPIPDPAYFRANQTFQTSTIALQAGDAYSSPFFTVREWLEVI